MTQNEKSLDWLNNVQLLELAKKEWFEANRWSNAELTEFLIGKWYTKTKVTSATEVKPKNKTKSTKVTSANEIYNNLMANKKNEAK